MHLPTLADRLQLLIVGSDGNEGMVRLRLEGEDELVGKRVIHLRALVYEYDVIEPQYSRRRVLHQALILAISPDARMNSLDADVL